MTRVEHIKVKSQYNSLPEQKQQSRPVGKSFEVQYYERL